MSNKSLFSYCVITYLSILTIIQIDILTCETESLKECLIHNQAYSYEYLFIERNYDKTKRNVYTLPLNNMKDFNHLEFIRWNIIPFKETNSYFIKSLLLDDGYLCSSKHLNGFFTRTRSIIGLKIPFIHKYFNSQTIIDNCLWYFDRDETSNKIRNKTFIIWNKKYKEPLYASVKNYFSDPLRRNVYSLNGRYNIKSKAIKWIVDCGTGQFQII